MITGWWYTYPSEKSWSSSVGKDYPIYEMESHKIHVPNHQPVKLVFQDVAVDYFFGFTPHNFRSLGHRPFLSPKSQAPRRRKMRQSAVSPREGSKCRTSSGGDLF